MIDLAIPLGTGSKSGNDELKIFLRSIEKYGTGIRNILVVTDHVPDWLTGVQIVPMGDAYEKNKDGNIIRKVLATAVSEGISEEFAWSSDDIALLKPFDFETMPPIYNARGKDRFPADGSIWQRRVRRTFEFLESRNLTLAHNYESHTPHRYPARKLVRAMREIDYAADIGYSINTLFHGLLGMTGGFDQRLFKETCEKNSGWKLDKPLIGYNDTAFLGGLRKVLFKLFPDKSKYER